MSDLDNLMNSSATSATLMALTPQHMGQQPEMGSVSTAAVTPVNNSVGAVLSYNELNCETLAYNPNNNQLLNTLIAENSYKNEDTNCLTNRQSTELTFSDLTQPVPNVSTLESNRLLIVDTNLPTVDGVSGAVPEPKSVLSLQQMNSMATESPSIEIPTNETIVPSMAPKDNQSLMVVVADNQYSNIFQPVINGPSGSAPQTPAPSPIASMETTVQTVMPTDTGIESQQMPVMTTFDSNPNSFANSSVATDVYNVPISQMVPVLSDTNVPTVTSDGPLTLLGVEPALQEQLLDAIPPPSVNFPPGPVPTDEKGIPSALPGEFPLSLPAVEEEKVGGIESASVPLDKIEATINMNAKPIPTLTDAVSVSQSEVNLIKSLPQSPQQSTGSQSDVATAQQEFNLNYANHLQTSANHSVYSTAGLSQTAATDQLTGPPPNQQQPNQTAQQTSPTLQQSISQTQSLRTLTTLQPSQSVLTPVSHSQSVSTSLVNVPEVQLPPPPAPPSATSIGVFETNPNGLMSDIVSQSQMSSVMPPPPLQPMQSVNQLPEMNTLTNLVPVVEATDPSLRQPLCVVIKSEPQSYNETVNSPKVNDDNNNPILHNSTSREKDLATGRGPSLLTELRGFPLCVISTTPTPYVSKNKATIVAPKCELTLPPKKAKFTSHGLLSVTPQSQSSLSSHTLKTVSTSQAIPSTGMLYDLPHHTSEQSSNSSPTFRVQSGLTQPLKLPHSKPLPIYMTPPFTTVSPILLSNLMPTVSVIDGPLSLVKEEKMRQLISANHPDYPAISGLLSFIGPYHKSLTTSAVTTGQQPISVEVPLSLSVKSSLNTTPVTANSLSQSHPSSHVPSLTRPSVHLNQSITSAANVVHTQPTAVPVSVVTSVVDHNRGFSQRIKSVGQNSAKNKINAEHSNSQVGVKLQLAPLLSGDPAKPFQCALCGKHLASKNVYQLHLRSHSGEKPFTCNLCGHSFSQKTSLTRHMRSHTGERPFPCQVCGKRFADKERIKIHMRTHTGEKPFACDICGKQFSQKSTVKRHMSVHTGEKPFKCETCGKGFANRGNLTAHTKTHSNS